ncbi:hypothetical protein Tco_1316512 [Tanacetum coccineum]
MKDNPTYVDRDKDMKELTTKSISMKSHEGVVHKNSLQGRLHGRTFNWQTATFGKVKNYEDEDDCFIDFETEFPAIVFDNTALPSEPMIISVNELNTDSGNDNDIDIIQSSEGNETTPEANGLSETNMAPLPAADQRHPWLRYQVKGYTEGIVRIRLRMVYTGEGQQVFVSHAWRRLFGIRAPLVREFILEFLSTCRMSDTEMGLNVTDTLCFQLGEQEMAEAGFGAYWDNSNRLIPDKGDLKDYWIKISSDKDFLGLTPSYILIRDPVRILCHRMIAYSISGRGQAPEKVTGVDLFYLRRGHFIGRLAMHFSLVGDEGLRGLQVVTRELLLIDLHEVGRLNICSRFGDTWAWVAQGPERQQATAAGAHKADEAGPAAKEGAQEIPTPAQVPPPPPLAPQPRTMSQRIERIEKELMDVSGHTYQAFNNTLVGSSRMPYQRHVSPRMGDASTSVAPHTDAHPDP